MTSQRTTNHKWTGGNAMPWALGVTLGLILGMVLLIAIPRMLGGKPAATAASTESNAATPAAPASGATASAPATDAASSTNAAATPAGNPGAAAGATDQPAQPADKADTAKADTNGDAAAGKEKFAGTCAGCHGANAEGAVGPNLRPTNAWTPEQFASAVREGKAPDKTLAAMMPHFTADQLSDSDLANVHAFIKSLN